jgi:diguanylate cyclase (GGDEF)-like protein
MSFPAESPSAESQPTETLPTETLAAPASRKIPRSGYALGMDGVGPDPTSGEALRAIWQEHRTGVMERVGLIELAVAALRKAELDEGLRIEAQRAAHLLIGSVGTFGFTRASEVARELELELSDPNPARAQAMAKLLATVYRELESEVIVPRGTRRTESTHEQLRVLIVDDDREFCARIAAEAASHDIGCETTSSPMQARAACAGRPPAIVLLDLTFPPDGMADAYDLLSELTSMTPPIPVLVLTGSGAFTDRVEVARRGGRAFLSKALLPSEVLSAATQFLARERLQRTRVLVVDDDPAMLSAMRVLLEAHEIEVCTLADPLRFWDTLEEVAPELLILDVDMPGVNGPELCRVVRNDPRWSQIAVIFVTAHKDPATIEGIFQAGADDHLAKPIVEAELITRVSNRLDRVRLRRMQAEMDSLTGLARRAKSSEGLALLLSLAGRFGQPVSVAMLDLDHFKQVNDTHGHAAGDAVLRGLGERLRRDFRGDDVVGRWGGEEFIIGMYGMTREDGVRRITDTLEHFSDAVFTAGLDTFTVSFSAGVAEYPLDGPDLGTVVKAADEALYGAKEAGRTRVLQASTSYEPD